MARYQEDILSLNNRQASMRKLTGVVWRTRAIISYRRHFISTVRAQPKLTLPQNPEDHGHASKNYRKAATEIRDYLVEIRRARQELTGPLPEKPSHTQVEESLIQDVMRERDAILESYDELIEKMDIFADRLVYLSDWSNTHNMSSIHAPDMLQLEEGVDQSLREVADALGDIHHIAAHAESLLDAPSLASVDEGIKRLERKSQDMKARLDAELELEEFIRAVPSYPKIMS